GEKARITTVERLSRRLGYLGSGVRRLAQHLVDLHPRPDIVRQDHPAEAIGTAALQARVVGEDRKSTRLNSSHEWISYAVFCFIPTYAPELSALSLHDALPIFGEKARITTVERLSRRLGYLGSGVRRLAQHLVDLHPRPDIVRQDHPAEAIGTAALQARVVG